MRLTARLTLLAACIAGALFVLLPLLLWSFVAFDEARTNVLLARKIRTNFLERTTFRDQYFLYREPRMQAMWESNKAAAEELLLQAEARFRDGGDRAMLIQLRRDTDDNAAIFRRIVGNTELLKAGGGSHGAYEELDRRLASQLLLKAAAVQEAATALEAAGEARVAQTYRRLLVLAILAATLFGAATIFAVWQLTRLIRRRLVPLHHGVKAIASGRLDTRIALAGSDEFTELGRDINAMARQLETSTHRLGEELSRNLLLAARQESDTRFRAWFELPLIGICVTSPAKGWLAVNDHLCRLFGYSREELSALDWAALTHPEDLTADLQLFERTLRGEIEGYSLEKRFLRKGGGAFPAELAVRCVRKADGSLDYFVALIQDITARRSMEEALRQRLRELDCLYGLSRISEAQGENLEGFLQGVAELLPAAWGQAERACARILYGGRSFGTGNYEASPWRLERPILVHGARVGSLEVGYLTARSEGDQDPFQAEEGRLLDAIAERVGHIAERIQAQREVRAQDELHRILLHAAMDGFWQVDPRGRLLEVNESYCRMSGYGQDELLTMAIHELEVMESGPEVEDHLRRIMSEGQARFETRHRRKDGSLFDVEICVQYRPAEGGRLVAFLRDITDRKRLEAERETAARLLALIDAPGDFRDCLTGLIAAIQSWSGCEAVGIRLQAGEDYPYYETRGFPPAFVQAENSLCARDSEGVVLRDASGNPVLECMCGNVLCGRTDPSKPFFTAHGSFWSNGTTALLASTTEADRQARTRNRCNGEGYESVALIPLRIGPETFGLLQFNDRQPNRFTADLIASFERIGDSLAASLARRQALETLRESEFFFRESQKAARTGSYTLDFVKQLWRPSEVLERLFGIEADHPRTVQGWLDLVHPEDRTMMTSYFRDEVLGGGSDFDKEYRIVRRADGEVRWVHGLGAVTFGASGDPIAMMGTISDVTERKQLEEEHQRLEGQLQRGKQLESLGRLAGGVAHDMNNVLAAILGLASAHIGDHPEGTPMHEVLATTIRAASRGGKMVRALLNFARRTPEEERELDMNELLQEEVQLLRHTTLAKVDFALDLAPDLRSMRGDPGALSHAVMNLCVNAVDAMPDSGRLTLATANVDNDWIEVRVEDSGSGMSQEVLAKALDPFFTTKGVGKGTGLGLSLVHSCVTAHRGQLDIQSESGRGTVVRMRFPAVAAAAGKARLLGDPGAGAGDGATVQSLSVLLVDDDELTRIAVQTILEALGHQTTPVDRGEEALDRLRAGFEPDLVILDMNMPGLGGAGTLPRLRDLRPELPVLLVTGRADQAALDLAAAHPGVTLLSKPFSLTDLQQQLARLWAADGPGQGGGLVPAAPAAPGGASAGQGPDPTPPTAPGPVVETSRFRAEHRELGILVGQLAALLDQEALGQDAGRAFEVLERLRTKLEGHVNLEDERFYPLLTGHPDPQVADVAKEFQKEGGWLKALATIYFGKWTSLASVQADPARFIHESNLIARSLARRIRVEDEVLFKLADRID